MVLSEVLITFLIVICLVCILGKDRPLWQILIGCFLAGMIPVTRINMLPILPFVLAYIFWEHGYKSGIYGVLVSLVPFLGFHLVYWPEIIQLWARWTPEGLIQAVDLWKPKFEGVTRLPRAERTIFDRFVAFIEGIRYHFPAMIGAFTTVFLWPKKWSDNHQKKISIFLLSLFVILLTLHAWVSLTQNSNIFAFSVYIGFFEILAILLVISTFNNWNYKVSIFSQAIAVIGLVIINLGIAYTSSEIGSSYGLGIQYLLTRKALTFEGGKILLASWKWWEVLKGRIGWEYTTSVRMVGFLLFLAVVVLLTAGITFLLPKLSNKIKLDRKTFLSYILVVYLALGVISSPTDFLGGSRHIYDCQIGVISTYEDAATEIFKYISPQEQIFWVGEDTEVVLIDLVEQKSIEIFPQMLNTRYTFRFGGDSDQLARRGFWNEELAQEWIDQSDTLLLEEQAFYGWFKRVSPLVDLGDFKQVGETSLTGCSQDERILIYQRAE